jgi:FMN phosphatase YigB (HAD superfamily)
MARVAVFDAYGTLLDVDHPNAIYELRFVVPVPLRGAALAPSRRRRSSAGN